MLSAQNRVPDRPGSDDPGRGRRLGVDVARCGSGWPSSDPDGILATPVETVRRERNGKHLRRLAALVDELGGRGGDRRTAPHAGRPGGTSAQDAVDVADALGRADRPCSGAAGRRTADHRHRPTIVRKPASGQGPAAVSSTRPRLSESSGLARPTPQRGPTRAESGCLTNSVTNEPIRPRRSQWRSGAAARDEPSWSGRGAIAPTPASSIAVRGRRRWSPSFSRWSSSAPNVPRSAAAATTPVTARTTCVVQVHDGDSTTRSADPEGPGRRRDVARRSSMRPRTTPRSRPSSRASTRCAPRFRGLGGRPTAGRTPVRGWATGDPRGQAARRHQGRRFRQDHRRHLHADRRCQLCRARRCADVRLGDDLQGRRAGRSGRASTSRTGR